jgi:hypothetical protein
MMALCISMKQAHNGATLYITAGSPDFNWNLSVHNDLKKTES